MDDVTSEINTVAIAVYVCAAIFTRKSCVDAVD